MNQIITALLIYSLGQIFVELFLKPTQSYLLVVSDIRYYLSSYVHSYGVLEKFYSDEIAKLEKTEASKFLIDLSIDRYADLIKKEWKNSDDYYFKFRDLAGQLRSKQCLAPWMIKAENLEKASDCLIALSNLTRSKEPGTSSLRDEKAAEILRILRFA